MTSSPLYLICEFCGKICGEDIKMPWYCLEYHNEIICDDCLRKETKK